MIFNYDPNNPPTCNIVVEKQGDDEKVCGQVATQMVNLADPDNTSRILAVVLVCDKHDHDLEEGKSLIAVAENGERIGVQYKTKKEESNHDAKS
jgi:hypothetical protein